MRFRLATLVLSFACLADASEKFVRLEHVPFMHVTDEQVFSCACPGAVEFCEEWHEKWRQDAAPEVRDQTVRECVIDFMLAIEEDARETAAGAMTIVDLQTQSFPAILEILRRDLADGRDLAQLFVIVDSTPTDEQAAVGSCTRQAIENAMNELSERFREAVTDLFTVPRNETSIPVLYISCEEWQTASLIIPSKLICSAPGGKS